MLEGDFFYGGESLLQDMTARVLQRRKRTVTLMAHTVYDAAATVREQEIYEEMELTEDSRMTLCHNSVAEKAPFRADYS